MKKSTTVLLCIMIASFVLSFILFFVSGAIFLGSGAKKITDCVISGDSDGIIGSCEGISISKDDGVKVDLPGIHVIVDDKGTDVKVLGIHVDYRDDDEETSKS